MFLKMRKSAREAFGREETPCRILLTTSSNPVFRLSPISMRANRNCRNTIRATTRFGRMDGGSFMKLLSSALERQKQMSTPARVTVPPVTSPQSLHSRAKPWLVISSQRSACRATTDKMKRALDVSHVRLFCREKKFRGCRNQSSCFTCGFQQHGWVESAYQQARRTDLANGAVFGIDVVQVGTRVEAAACHWEFEAQVSVVVEVEFVDGDDLIVVQVHLNVATDSRILQIVTKQRMDTAKAYLLAHVPLPELNSLPKEVCSGESTSPVGRAGELKPEWFRGETTI